MPSKNTENWEQSKNEKIQRRSCVSLYHGGGLKISTWRPPWLDIVAHGRPGGLGVLVGNDAGDRAFGRIGIVLADRQDAHAFTILVLLAATVDALFLLVLRLDVAANVLSVDLDGAPELHLRPALADRLPDLGEQHPSGLVLDTEFAGEVHSSKAFPQLGSNCHQTYKRDSALRAEPLHIIIA